MTAPALDLRALWSSAPPSVLLVAAHPDDETVGAGSLLAGWPRLTLLHVTNGAPRDPWFMAQAGVASAGEYAALRAAELERALAAGQARARRRSADLVDQEAALALPRLVRSVAETIASVRPDVVLTHAYEGGHPDHDAAAFAVAAALELVAAPPPLVEMAGYFEREGALVTGRFLDESAMVEHRLDAAACRRKQAMLDCFVSQRTVLARFDPSVERFRPAPRYDFTAPPHAGPLHYERCGWPLSGARFGELTAAAQARLASPASR